MSPDARSTSALLLHFCLLFPVCADMVFLGRPYYCALIVQECMWRTSQAVSVTYALAAESCYASG